MDALRSLYDAPAGMHVPTRASIPEMEALAHNRKAAIPRQRIQLTALHIRGFVQTYLHEKYDDPKPIPGFHMEMWENDCSDEPNVLNIAPRGHAKSTANTEAYGLATMLFRIRDFGVIIANTYDQSVEFLEDIKRELTENEPLRKDFGIHKLIRDREDDIIVLFHDGYKFRLLARGSEQKIRGLKWNKRRPNFFLCDDLEDDEQVASKERRRKFMRWFQNALLPAGSKDALFRVSGTIMHFDSLLENLSKDTDNWKTLRFRAHKGFNDFTEILWPEMFDEARLRKIRSGFIKQGNSDGYSSEYLNYPIAEGDSFFRPEDLLPMEDHHYKILLRKYAAWDFATGGDNTDFTVCVVVGVDSNNRYYVIDVRRDRWASDKIIEEMFSVQRAHGCDVQYAEKGQIEKVLGPFLYNEMRHRDEYFNVVPIQPIKDKPSRAQSWRAKTRAHAVRYDHKASWWEALLEEMRRFPKDEHDDQVDAQSLFGLSLEAMLSAPTTVEAQNEEYEEEFGAISNLKGRSKYGGY